MAYLFMNNYQMPNYENQNDIYHKSEKQTYRSYSRPREFGKDLTNLNNIENNPTKYFNSKGNNYKVEDDNKKLIKGFEEYLQNQKNAISKEKNHSIYDCPEYAHQISLNMKKIEKLSIGDPFYINSNSEITEKMRGIILDWLCDAHVRLNMQPETLYLAINYFDRYTSKDKTAKSCLQLNAIASLFLASKYEEIYPPDIRDFVYIGSKCASKLEIIKTEQKILKLLKFEVSYPTTYRFLQLYANLLNSDEKQFYLAQFICESQFYDSSKIGIAPSDIALGSIYLSAVTIKNSCWNEKIKEESQRSESEAISFSNDMKKGLNLAIKGSFSNVRKKFLSKKYMEVASFKIEGINSIFI